MSDENHPLNQNPAQRQKSLSNERQQAKQIRIFRSTGTDKLPMSK
jgi:hypothetical protein